MISYERIDCSEGIDLGKSDKSVKCMICNYWCFADGLVLNINHMFVMDVMTFL